MNLFSKFKEYIKTDDYVEGLFVELSGLFFEVIIIVILVPILINIITKFNLRYNVFLANFYTIQIMHSVIDLLLEHFCTINESERHKILLKQLKKDKKFFYGSHPFYGNIENKIFILKYAYENKKYKQYADLDFQTMELALSDTNNILNEIDQQMGTFSQLTKQLKVLFGIRIMVYGFRDCLNTRINISNKTLKNTDDFLWERDLTTILQGGSFAFEYTFKKLKGPFDNLNG